VRCPEVAEVEVVAVAVVGPAVWVGPKPPDLAAIAFALAAGTE